MRHKITLLLIWFCYISNQANETFVVPFIAVDNLIFVKGSIAKKSGYFLIDTGSPALILNNKYFEGYPSLFSDAMQDVNGNVLTAQEFNVKKMQIGNWQKTKILAKVMNLNHLEISKKIPIHGIVGYSVFSKFEMIFDYENGQLIIHKLGRKGKRLNQSYFQNNPPTDSLDLKMTRHFPFISGVLNGKKVRFVIDSGSEINMIEKHLFRGKNELLQIGKPVFVRGFSNKRKRVATAKVNQLKINDLNVENAYFALTEMDVFYEKGSVGFDGILGSEFLSQYKIAINYRQKKMYLWKGKPRKNLMEMEIDIAK